MAYAFNGDKTKTEVYTKAETNGLFVEETIYINQDVNIAANNYNDLEFQSSKSSSNYKILSVNDMNISAVKTGTSTYIECAFAINRIRVYTNNSVDIRVRNLTSENITIGNASSIKVLFLKTQ